MPTPEMLTRLWSAALLTASQAWCPFAFLADVLGADIARDIYAARGLDERQAVLLSATP